MPLREAPRVAKFTETECRMAGARGRGRGWELVFDGYRAGEDRKVLEMGGGDDCTTM